MLYGILLMIIGVLMFFTNIGLIMHYNNSAIPGIMKDKTKMGDEYMWEQTAGLGIVPKWVSTLGLLSPIVIVIGIIMLIINLLK